MSSSNDVPSIESSLIRFTPHQLEQLRYLFTNPATTTTVNVANVGAGFATLTAGSTCFLSSISNNSMSWAIDTGAMYHHEWLTNLEINNPHSSTVSLSNGHKAIASHIGSYILHAGDVLMEVWLVPDFQYNLISVSRLTKDLNCVDVFP